MSAGKQASSSRGTLSRDARLRRLGFSSYAAYLKSGLWNSNKARLNLPRRCWICVSDHDLHAHHRSYKNVGAEQSGDLIVLCDVHHQGLHRYIRRRRAGLSDGHYLYRKWLLSSEGKTPLSSQRFSALQRLGELSADQIMMVVNAAAGKSQALNTLLGMAEHGVIEKRHGSWVVTSNKPFSATGPPHAKKAARRSKSSPKRSGKNEETLAQAMTKMKARSASRPVKVAHEPYRPPIGGGIHVKHPSDTRQVVVARERDVDGS